MKKLVSASLLTIATTLLSFNVTSTAWKLNANNYAVKFSGKRVDGTFKGLKTDIIFDGNNLPSSHINASIDANTVNTGNSLKSKHARQGLDAEKYPTIHFVSSSITKKGNGYEAQGKLTIKDVTKQISLPFTFTPAGNTGIFAGSFTIKTEDYHIDKMGTPDEVTISLNVPVNQ